MRTGMLTSSLSRSAGGIFDATRWLARSLAVQQRHAVEVFGLRDAHTDEDRAGWGSLNVHAFQTRGPAEFGYAPGMAQALREANLDLIHLHGLWMYPSIASSQWSGKTGRPFVISPHGMLDPWALANSAWKKRVAASLFESKNLQSAKVLHALNRAEHDAIRQYGLKNPIAILPNGVDPDISEEDHGPPLWANHLPAGAKVLLFLGRLHPKKGLVPLLHAIALARAREMEDWHLVVAGWDQNGHRSELEALVQELGLMHRVVFIGPVYGTQKHAALAGASAFVLPSFSEGLPMAVLEAWAFDLPVLMTSACNLPEGFDAHAALRIDTEPSVMAVALDEFARLTDDERAKMGMRGRRLAQERFSWGSVAERMRATYEWILGGGAAPSWVETDMP